MASICVLEIYICQKIYMSSDFPFSQHHSFVGKKFKAQNVKGSIQIQVF